MEPENNSITPDRKNLLKGYNMLLYFAGSMIMNEPTDECVIDFWVSGNLKKLPVTSLNPRFIKAASLLKDSCDDKEKCRKGLEEDYYRLFAVTGLPLAPAQASIYLADKESAIKKVNEFYYSYGWQLKPMYNIPADHLGIELLFLTNLVDKYMALDDGTCCFEMRNEIRRYIDHHLLSWIPKWNEDVQEYAHTRCYKGIGTLIHAGVEDLYKIFS